MVLKRNLEQDLTVLETRIKELEQKKKIKERVEETKTKQATINKLEERIKERDEEANIKQELLIN
ncbi:7349_t:CDS:2 [Funneliformis mosseae]|uniref:7349_t:CDS:1 n=1 Tax=Funneliformis mosseae TaxID=27381 RepID=A0A9N9NA67_FUNMO|nr:7349_t:CDS:2 [Funneliformis mosseae]